MSGRAGSPGTMWWKSWRDNLNLQYESDPFYLMRLAFFSPLNPIPSGISDYSEELLPLLVREFDIELIVDNYRPTNPVLSQLHTRTLEQFKASAGDFDLVLYQMGNSPAHINIFKTLREIPGVVVMHDVVLHHLRAWQTLDRGDVTGYLQIMREDYGEAGAELARLEARGLVTLDRFAYPLNGAVVRAAHALIVHSEYAARQIQPLAPQTPVAVIPMGIAPAGEIPASEARSRLALPADAFIIAAFGEVHPYKRVTVALQAFSEFRSRYPNSLFVMIGRESPNYDVEALVRSLGLSDAVLRVGFAPSREYADYIAAADLSLNLRYPTAGETSASLLRLLAAAKAVIVTRADAYAELPDDVCAKIEADEYEHDLLVGHLEFLAQRADVRSALGANARDFVTQCHTLEQEAAAYADFLHAVVEGRAQSRSYLKERTEDGGWRTEDGATSSRRRVPASSSAPALLRPRSSVLGPSTPGVARHLPPIAFPDSLVQDYAELGLEADDSTLASVARAVAEMGLGEKPGT